MKSICIEAPSVLTFPTYFGGYCEFVRFAFVAQPLVGVKDGSVVADGGDDTHVQRIAKFGAAAPDGSSSLEGAAVAGVGREADKGGDLAAGRLAEFGQFGEQGSGGNGADS